MICNENNVSDVLKTFGEEADHPRGLKMARNDYLYSDLTTEQDVVKMYKEWVNTDTYLALRQISTGQILLKKASKRGNDVYIQRTKQKINLALSYLDEIPTKNYYDTRGSLSNHLFLVLTYDTKRCSIVKAWENIGHELNLFMAKLRKVYGNVKVICRTYENFKNFYPHINLLLKFEKPFYIFKRDKKFRIARYHKDKIDSLWHSFIDVTSGKSVSNIVKYSTKYIMKNVTKEDNYENIAMQWIFQKRSFHIDMKEFSDLNYTSISKTKIIKTITLLGNILHEEVVKEWELVEVYYIKPINLSTIDI